MVRNCYPGLYAQKMPVQPFFLGLKIFDTFELSGLFLTCFYEKNVPKLAANIAMRLVKAERAEEALKFLDNQPVICVQQLDANHLLVGVDNYNKF